MRWRDRPREEDRLAVRDLVRTTGFFSTAELDIAVELVDEALAHGSASGYEFVFADADEGGLLGYACYGPIPGQHNSFDLYWIAVAPGHQRGGLGRQLIQEAERRVRSQGASDMFIDTSGRAQYKPTRQFYERMGYVQNEVAADFYAPGDDKVIYRKRFAEAASIIR